MLFTMIQGNVTVMMLALIAYNREIVIPAIEMAMQELRWKYPTVRFNLTMMFNPTNQQICGQWESTVTDDLAKFYQENWNNDTFLVLVPTGEPIPTI